MLPLFKEYDLKEPVLKQRIMRSRWGSCMPLKGIVTMNTYLAIMPEAIIDHVMLHELCHFIHPNHSRHFYDVMTRPHAGLERAPQGHEPLSAYCI